MRIALFAEYPHAWRVLDMRYLWRHSKMRVQERSPLTQLARVLYIHSLFVQRQLKVDRHARRVSEYTTVHCNVRSVGRYDLSEIRTTTTIFHPIGAMVEDVGGGTDVLSSALLVHVYKHMSSKHLASVRVIIRHVKIEGNQTHKTVRMGSEVSVQPFLRGEY